MIWLFKAVSKNEKGFTYYTFIDTEDRKKTPWEQSINFPTDNYFAVNVDFSCKDVGIALEHMNSSSKNFITTNLASAETLEDFINQHPEYLI